MNEQLVFPTFVKVGEVEEAKGGLSKRELFAAMAMQGLLANPSPPKTTGQEYLDKLVFVSVMVADGLLEGLEKKK